MVETNVTRTRETRPGSQVKQLEAASVQDLCKTVVVVLVDDDHAQLRKPLRPDGCEETRELADTSYRRDDEVERRELSRHGP